MCKWFMKQKKSFFWIWPCLDLRCIFSRLRFFARSGDSKISFNAFYLFDSGTLEPQPQFLHSCHQRGSDGWSLIKNSHILVLILCSGSSYFRLCLNVLWWLRLFSYMFLWERQTISKPYKVHPKCIICSFAAIPIVFQVGFPPKKQKKPNQNKTKILLHCYWRAQMQGSAGQKWPDSK